MCVCLELLDIVINALKCNMLILFIYFFTCDLSVDPVNMLSVYSGNLQAAVREELEGKHRVPCETNGHLLIL